mmetsp:Transcript_48051/g.55363  ORF Transcript_48051/g.55363 Transcript_48051/m.55363 type:complete len:230 (+) Transcript_48051:120-809(+)|eukprot:CAMPEP_0115026250 /NCGR_PEP_ID=MMETSP0216-20121206/34612_1 /TAXON_ID=223996 /ORGANISM="Protocruzia adherens, Strain Boccale" /LENGTH=229 /DNA_ID=CAMNT_0002401245 /DNA_START=110 /DNA_END=799 /DNA_ORIENTATION=+
MRSTPCILSVIVTFLAIGSAREGDISLPLISALVGDFDGNNLDGTEFYVGDDVFMRVSPLADQVENIEGTVRTVIVTDMRTKREFDLTKLQETRVLGSGGVITRVPLIIVTSQAKVSLTVEWSTKDGNRRLLAEDSNNLITYSTLIEIGVRPNLGNNKNNIESAPSNDDSDTDGESNNDLTIILVSAIVGGALILGSVFVGYKIMMKNKKKREHQGMTPVASHDLIHKI